MTPSSVSGQRQRPKVHLLALGIGKYSTFSSLTNPALDARLVAEAVRKLPPIFDQVEMSLIIDGTRKEISSRAEYAR